MSFLERTQILSTSVSKSTAAYHYEKPKYRERYFRHVSEGGWPFSTSAHGWPISDCTGEGLKAVLCLQKLDRIKQATSEGRIKVISTKRLENAVNVILELQNTDGGFATYENNRGFGWFEWLNPSEVFGDIMIDYSYAECTMASLTALREFHDSYPTHRGAEIKEAMRRGSKFLKSIQRPDGSWYGSWACCFCYGTWFGVEGLIAAGEDARKSREVRRACEFLMEKQCGNGGWGEDFRSCYNKSYAETNMERYGDEDGACVVNTSWALLALVKGGMGGREEVRRGVRYLVERQLPSGDWPQEGISGVFNRSCGITYTAYRNVFPIWALGRYDKWRKEEGRGEE
jgi:squalene/oxidosqualene cyclase-like protein